jgi:hypothetical protein
LNFAQGLTIDERTSRCRWIGDSMDYSQAIEWMQCKDERERAQGNA